MLVQGKTAKVNAARSRADVFVVWSNWLIESIALWRRLDETSYLLHDQNNTLEDLLAESNGAAPLPDSPKSEAGDDIDLNDGAVDMDWGSADAELDAFLEETGA